MTMNIGIIGYGMVGKAVEFAFSKANCIISDPSYNTTTIQDVIAANTAAIFVCVPTPTDGTNYKLLKDVLTEIRQSYDKLIIVKSTVLPEEIVNFNVVYNPEFLSRATSFDDFVNPPLVIFGGNDTDTRLAAELYAECSTVDLTNVIFTDIKTASLTKYTMNSFYATKVTFMNGIHNVAKTIGADYDTLVKACKMQPWMGTHHFDVPGPDGKMGFGGPCLPKDTKALSEAYYLPLLNEVLKINNRAR
jgi:UDPglucose 6-dehydrogenase